MDLLEINAPRRGVFRPGAFFLALDEEVDGLRGLFRLGWRFGRELFVERAPADAREAEAEHDEDTDEEGENGIQGAQPLHGEEHTRMIAHSFCHNLSANVGSARMLS